MNSFITISKKEKADFYKSQYEYYKGFNTAIVIIASLASLTYFISDCQLYGYFQVETLPTRFAIVIPLIIYVTYTRLVDKWKMEMIFSHCMGHLIMWCTIFSIWFLPNKQYASDGFLIIQIVILMLGFASTFSTACISQLMVIVNILISNIFNHYEDLNIMMSLGLPCAFGIICAQYVFTQSYYETYTMNKKLENLSYIDQLTTVYNRHKLDEITRNKKFILDNKDISLLILDVDFFKHINDTYGHDNGDLVLKELAGILKSNIRSDDILIRWGGEEFLIILYNCNETQAIKVAEKIRRKVEQYNGKVCKLTVSIGVSMYKEVNYRDTIREADKALYKAKNSGRNKVVSYKDI